MKTTAMKQRSMKQPLIKHPSGYFLISILTLLFSFSLHADDALTALSLQQEWDHANFEITDKKQKAATLKVLAEKGRSAAEQQSADASIQIWAGIILSTYAGEAGLSALGLVKEAKKYFEKAITLDPNSMQGSAYTSLGSLYYQVPGWPVGFGDDDKAEEFLKKGLELDPEGVDANYFYADYLLDQKEYRNATIYLEKVLNAAPREGRESADKGRKAQAQAALENAREKIK